VLPVAPLRRLVLVLLAAAMGAAATAPPAGAQHMAAGDPRAVYPLPAPAVQPEPCPPPPIPPSPPPPPLGPPTVPTAAVPVVPNPPARRVSLAPVTGKGIWLTVWPRDHVKVSAAVEMAIRYGLHTLWVRTGGTTDGFYGGALLRRLMPVARAAGVSVVAWDFPTLSDPAADALRAKMALAAGADAFSPDIEAAAEGTYLSARRVRYYLSLVRSYAGDRPVVATVPTPDWYWVGRYPYAAEAPFVDAFAPMVYWACNEPGQAVRQAVAYLSRWRSVVPIGQDYNMGPEGGPPGLPTPLEIWRFVDVARRAGAIGATLYDYESGGRAQLEALAAYPWGAHR
jgi:hypothetical protein